MTRRCCRGEGKSHRLVLRLATVAVSALPGAALVLLPKCPMCLAAWLTVATGFGFSAAGAGWVRWVFVILSFAAITLVARPIIRRQTRVGP